MPVRTAKWIKLAPNSGYNDRIRRHVLAMNRDGAAPSVAGAFRSASITFDRSRCTQYSNTWCVSDDMYQALDWGDSWVIDGVRGDTRTTSCTWFSTRRTRIHLRARRSILSSRYERASPAVRHSLEDEKKSTSSSLYFLTDSRISSRVGRSKLKIWDYQTKSCRRGGLRSQ